VLPACAKKILAVLTYRKLANLFKDYLKPEVLEETRKYCPSTITSQGLWPKKPGPWWRSISVPMT
jgi:hypothetical protein